MTKSTWAKSSCLFFFFFLFFSYVFLSNVAFLFLIYFFLLISRCGALFLFFFLMVCSATLPPLFFSFDFLGVALCVCVSFCLTRNDFFLFLNLGDFFFWGCLSLFYFNWALFFNKSILVNLHNFFFHSSIFSLPI